MMGGAIHPGVLYRMSDLTAATPVGNTGLTPSTRPYTAHLDTLVLCGKGVPLRRIVDIIDRLLNCQFDTSSDYTTAHGMRYDHNIHAQYGLLLSYIPSDWDSTVTYRLSIPGKICNSVPQSNLLQLCRTFKRWGCHATRFDWAIDDYTKVLPMQSIVALAEDECYYGARKFDLYKTRTKGSIEEGVTVYIGRAGGTQRLAVYDKFVESKGAIDAIRFEYRFFDEKADYFLDRYIRDGDCEVKAREISGYCFGRIGFVEKTGCKKKNIKLVRAWEILSNAINEKIASTIPTKPTTIEDKKKWIEKSIAPSLGILLADMGWGKFTKWLYELISQAKKKMKNSAILGLKFLRDWEDLMRFGGDYWRMKSHCDTQKVEEKLPIEEQKSSIGNVFLHTKTVKLESTNQPLTLVEQLSLKIPSLYNLSQI